MLKKIDKKECILCMLMVVVVAATTGFQYLLPGLAGHVDDLAYHLLRIESVKEALLAGKYPARVNSLFFGGYGYGSSLFYPDMFLVIPALLRIIGLSPSVVWKAYVLFLAVAGSITTYLSFKYIVRNSYYAVAGTVLLMLSQFYVADILQRSGLSEYTAFVFMPILVAGIYDFVACEGKKVYLMGVAFVGLVLSHTIMTVIGLLVTSFVFVIVLLVPANRKRVLKPGKLLMLLGTAFVTVLAVSFYIFPMMEQMVHDEFLYMEPWAQIGDYTQPFRVFFYPTGDFDFVAYVGIGIPVLMLLGSRLLLGKPQNRWADFFLVGGILILLSTTDIVPWEKFNDTFLNMLQFTFRLYPYALCFMILGLMMYFSEKCVENQKCAMLLVVGLAVGFGAWQAVASYQIEEDERRPISLEFVQENTHYVGWGEWLPVGVPNEVRYSEAKHNVLTSGNGELEFVKNGYNDYSFEKNGEDGEEYILPLIYYKGYKACIVDENGEKTGLTIERTADALVKISVEDGLVGDVRVWYGGTIVQCISNIISLLVIIGVVIFIIMHRRKESQMFVVEGEKEKSA